MTDLSGVVSGNEGQAWPAPQIRFDGRVQAGLCAVGPAG